MLNYIQSNNILNMSIEYTGIFALGCPPIHFTDNHKMKDIICAVVQIVDIYTNQKRSFSANNKTLFRTIQIIVKDEIIYASACTEGLSHTVAFNYLNVLIEEIEQSGLIEIEHKFSIYIKQLMKVAPGDFRFNPSLIINNKTTAVETTSSEGEQLLDSGAIFTKMAKGLKCTLIRENIKYIFVLMCISTFILISAIFILYFILYK